jgi:DNA-binding HxlR family transcriptional regulator
MNAQQTSHQTCVSSLKLLGDYWTLRIIDSLKDGSMRYCGVQRACDDVNPVTLSTRLKKLEEAKLVERTQESRTEVVYELTNLGREILPVLEAVDRFSEKASI